MMEHIFILNPNAGKGKQAEQMEAKAIEFGRRHKLNLTCHRTESPQHAQDLVRQIASAGNPVRFYACGGDGTMHYVLQGMVGYDHASMTVVPVGTGNDFLRNFGHDISQFANLDALLECEEFELDLIECNDRYCLTIACFGVDARVGRDVHKFSKLPGLSGKGGYVCSAIYNACCSINRHWQVTVDGKGLTGDYAVVSVCNGRHYGGGFNPIPQARLDDGVLNAITVSGIGLYRFSRLFSHYCAGRHQAIERYIRLFQPKVVEIRSYRDDIAVCLDGESVQSDYARVTLSDKKLRFFAPKGTNPNATASMKETVAINS